MTTATWPLRLRALRKAMGLTQAQMARALGYTQASHVGALEGGTRPFTPMLERLIEALERIEA